MSSQESGQKDGSLCGQGLGAKCPFHPGNEGEGRNGTRRLNGEARE